MRGCFLFYSFYSFLWSFFWGGCFLLYIFLWSFFWRCSNGIFCLRVYNYRDILFIFIFLLLFACSSWQISLTFYTVYTFSLLFLYICTTFISSVLTFFSNTANLITTWTFTDSTIFSWLFIRLFLCWRIRFFMIGYYIRSQPQSTVLVLVLIYLTFL